MRNLELTTTGACRSVLHDPDLWHDDDTVAQAKAICLTCPVLAACLEYATDPATVAVSGCGVWGGETARKRNALRRVRALNLTIDGRYAIVIVPAPRVTPELTAYTT